MVWTNESDTKKRRDDIDGLRALSVIGVVLFHFNASILPGGYAGVDVFFVITGYLMASIISDQLIKNNFSYYAFYVSRAKRIAPGLAAVVATMLLFGFLFLGPSAYKSLGSHSLSSLLFYSNIHYFLESGYFAELTKDKFLLHTWSLSVEWQIYLVFPYFLHTLFRYVDTRNLGLALIVVAFLMLATSLSVTYYNKELSYMMPFSRAWEMLAGSTVGFIKISTLNPVAGLLLEILSITCILVSFVVFNDANSWPSLLTLLPVISASIFIVIPKQSSILALPAMRQLGLMSYSVYLTHWVILVCARKLYIDLSFYCYVLATLGCAIVLHHLVEKRRNFGAEAFVFYVLLVFISIVVSANGVPERLIDVSQYAMSMQEFRNQNEGHLHLDQSNGVEPIYINSDVYSFDYILLGNSKARQYNYYLQSHGIKVASFAIDGCMSTKNITNSKSVECEAVYFSSLKFIKDNPSKKIIWASTWPIDMHFTPRAGGRIKSNNSGNLGILANEIEEFINDIKGYKHNLYLIGDLQGSNGVLVFECLAKENLPFFKLFGSQCEKFQPKNANPTNEMLISLANSHESVYAIISENSLCDDTKCAIIVNGQPVYTDYKHLTKSASEIVGAYIFRNINSSIYIK